jgi:hypothetical protein
MVVRGGRKIAGNSGAEIKECRQVSSVQARSSQALAVKGESWGHRMKRMEGVSVEKVLWILARAWLGLQAGTTRVVSHGSCTQLKSPMSTGA